LFTNTPSTAAHHLLPLRHLIPCSTSFYHYCHSFLRYSTSFHRCATSFYHCPRLFSPLHTFFSLTPAFQQVSRSLHFSLYRVLCDRYPSSAIRPVLVSRFS